MSLLVRRQRLSDSVVFLLEIAAFHQFVHACQCFAGLGEDDHTAHWAVQSVDHAAEHIAGFVVTLFKKCLNLFRQTGVATLVALHQLSGQLVDGQEVVVFVNNLVGE